MAQDARWKAASGGSGMTDAEAKFLAQVLKDGPQDRLLGKLHREWAELWKAWEEAGKFQAGLEKAGVGSTEADTIFKSRLEPRIKRFQATFNDLMGHLTDVAHK